MKVSSDCSALLLLVHTLLETGQKVHDVVGRLCSRVVFGLEGKMLLSHTTGPGVIQYLALTSDPSFLPVQIKEGTGDGSVDQVFATGIGDLDWIPSCWLWTLVVGFGDKINRWEHFLPNNYIKIKKYSNVSFTIPGNTILIAFPFSGYTALLYY